MAYDLCRHIHTNGTQCGSPALHRKPYCFFHDRLYQRHKDYRQPAQSSSTDHIQLAPLEDRESIQVALSVIINALATGRLEPRRATALLYGLQLASSNAARLNLQPLPASVVRTARRSAEGLEIAPPGARGHNDLSFDPSLFLSLQPEDPEDEEAGR
jgi:hypothetical protein